MKAISINVRKFMLEIFGDKLIDRSKLQQDIEDERIKGERIKEQKRLETERLERERLERERQEKIRQERERLERERQERIRQEILRQERERVERLNHRLLIYDKYNQIKNDIPALFKLDNNKLDKIKHSDNEQCIICLEDFKINEKCLYLNCLHIFHAQCIIEWLLKHDNCPICNENYKIDDYKLDTFLKSNSNNKLNNNNQIQIQPNNDNHHNIVVNNNVLNYIIQENDINHNLYNRGYHYQQRYRRGGNHRGRGYHAKHLRRNW